MKRMIILFIAFLLYSVCWAVNFKQVAYIDKGQRAVYGFIKAYDTNHDGYKELIFMVNEGLGKPNYIINYEYKPVNNYLIGDTICYWQFRYSFDIAETDDDTYTDLTTRRVSDTVSVFESINYNSYPKQQVWKINHPAFPLYFTDLDRDFKKEVFTVRGDIESLYVFENSGDNQYDLVWTFNGTGLAENWSTFAIGDFDGDSLTEFVTGTSGGKMIMWEHTGLDNQYQVVWFDSIVAYNSYDNINIGDINQDGNPEFVIGSHYNSGGNWRAKWSFFKSTGDNQYAKFFEDSLYDNHLLGDYYSASYSGDIDGDGHPEAVLARNNNWLIYKWQNGQVERLYKAYATDNGRDNTSLTVADMNGNGYDEIIESGSITDSTSETKIWEIMGEITWDSLTAVSKDSCIQIRWSTAKQFANYGFNLWRAVGADSNYSVIYDTNDTVKLDTLLQAYTFNDSAVTSGTTYYYKVQAKALNDSTLFFGPVNVLYTGVSGQPREPIIAYSFKLGQNAPNPFSHTTAIKYQIPQAVNVSLKVYNVAGQLVKVLMNEGTSPSNSSPRGEGRVGSITWDGRDQNNRNVSNGVYFYQLQAGKDSDIKKMVIIK
jgi:hypothetical protein